MKYTMKELKSAAKKCGCTVNRKNGEYSCKMIGDPETTRFFTDDSFDCYQTMHRMAESKAAFTAAATVDFKVLVMSESTNRIIDEYHQVRVSDLQNDSVFFKPFIAWLMRTLNNGVDMQRSGRINGMPTLRKAEGARQDFWKLRSEVHQMLHQTGKAHPAWNKVEAICQLLEEKL
jgi:hypothetical protein